MFTNFTVFHFPRGLQPGEAMETLFVKKKSISRDLIKKTLLFYSQIPKYKSLKKKKKN